MAQERLIERCPAESGIQSRPAQFEPGGLIITAYDSESLWVYDVDRDTRYTLPDVAPCMGNCHLSPDGTWLSYMNRDTLMMSKMRLTGTERTALFSGVADVLWWSNQPETYLAWTPDHRAFIQTGTDVTQRRKLPTDGVLSVQPGGLFALVVEEQNGVFRRAVINLESRLDETIPDSRVIIGDDVSYANASAWSPQGNWLAYVAPGAFDEVMQVRGSEIFIAQPGSTLPQQMTFFGRERGAVRIGGNVATALSPSPDGTRVAFWVIPLIGANPIENTAPAQLHVLDTRTGQVIRYCNPTTEDHTPTPPHLVWSPDSTHLSFALDLPEDGQSALLLLALNTETGALTLLNNGISPFVGYPKVVAWGKRP